MINIPEEVKQACNNISVTFREIIVVDEQEVVTKVKFSDDTYQDGNFFGTFIMKTIEFEAENNIDYKKKEVVYYREINGTRFKMGTFIVQSITENDTKESVKVTAYDYGLKFANKYITELDYKNTKVTMKDVINEVCTKVGVPLANLSFTNDSFIVDSNQFTEDAQYGTVVKAVAQMSGTFAKINENDKLEFIFDQTSDNIEEIEDYTELEDKRDTRPITVVVLGMSQVKGQEAIMRWAEGIAIYGENYLVINDNPFAYTQSKRTELIKGIFEKVKGFGYSSFVTKKAFKPYSQVGDLVKIKNRQGEWVNSIILRINANHQEIELSAPSIIDATVEYEQPPTPEDIANKAEFTVNQQEKTIQALVTSNTELVNKTTKLEIDVDKIKGEISEIADVTVTADGYGVINVENINESEPILVKIYPTAEDITPLRPKVGLYPRVGLRPHSRELLFVRTNNEDEPYSVEYNIPADLYKLDNYYDEFVLDYENQRCYINRNIGINENGEKYLLEIPTVEEFKYPTINLLEGNYKIYMPAFENAYIYVRLMTKNIYTSQFATKVELNSKIEQTSTNIELSVNQKLKGYSTTQEMNSAISIASDSITSSVSKTYATKVTTDTLASKIKQTATTIELTTTDNKTSAGITIKLKNEDGSQIDSKSANITLSGLVKFTDLSGSGTTTINGSNITTGTIDANKVTVKNLNASDITSGTLSASKISGGSLSLTGNNTSITSTNFSVTKDGVITAKSGTLGGWKIDSASISKTTGQYNLEIRSDRPANEAAILVWDTKSQGYNFYIRPDGFLYAKNADISGNIKATSGSISGSLITSGFSASNITAGRLNISDGSGHYLRMGFSEGDNPSVSGLNVMSYGIDMHQHGISNCTDIGFGGSVWTFDRFSSAITTQAYVRFPGSSYVYIGDRTLSQYVNDVVQSYLN